ncbi:DUF2218 domain-containing protein [Streptomyces sp. So13.3]|uniref:DUF2218 domain-containing protein n=1 Tax=Streptomyces TaxID=1883 RepID=UPI00164E5B1A|nr:MULTISPECIES: DUF2218 domain-containing protein [unclassified Streptomyces]MCZ4101583.1 DUF2218 domain-containing protein [Streptomyces sp. H39-C1]QNA76337.1 DUF2218 domain-containing protein [Streptomyces sp. So13.3]
MHSAEAEIPTDRASRYLVQLCKHFSNKGSALRHRPRVHAGGGRPVTEAEAALMQVQWSETRGEVDFGWARCTLRATSTALVIQAQAQDSDSLQRAMDVVTAHLGRYSRRQPLTVRWQPGRQGKDQAPSGHDTAKSSPRTERGSHPNRRGRRRWAGVAAVAVVAAGVHLGLFGWLVASSRWTLAAAGAVAAVVAIKVGVLAAVAVRRSKAAGAAHSARR